MAPTDPKRVFEMVAPVGMKRYFQTHQDIEGQLRNSRDIADGPVNLHL